MFTKTSMRRERVPTPARKQSCASEHRGSVQTAPRLNHDFSKIPVHAANNGGSIQRQHRPLLPQLDEKLFPPCDAVKGAKPCLPGQYRVGARGVTLQPVFFRTSEEDPSPTGASWDRRFERATQIWEKVGVYFFAAAPKVITTDALVKTPFSGEQVQKVLTQFDGAGIEVFVVDSYLTLGGYGGGLTAHAGTAAAKVVISDLGSSDTLLAHELGHVLGLDHPPSRGDAKTIMEPSNSADTANPDRNTLANHCFISWPKPNLVGCIEPDR